MSLKVAHKNEGLLKILAIFSHLLIVYLKNYHTKQIRYILNMALIWCMCQTNFYINWEDYMDYKESFFKSFIPNATIK